MSKQRKRGRFSRLYKAPFPNDSGNRVRSASPEMSEFHELNGDCVCKDGEQYYFKFAVVDDKFSAEQLRVILNTTEKEERRAYLLEIIDRLNRLNRRALAQSNTQ
jgi:hypothetical protein